MKQVKKGDRVRVHFSSFLDDGTIYESTLHGDPLKMTVGEFRVVPGFDSALTGMKAGDTKTVFLEAEDAYGLRRDDLIFKVSKSEVESDEKLRVGSHVKSPATDGEIRDGTVTELHDKTLQIDANHPLAGQYVIFEIKLVEIV
jgi:FKBP-type peptidyl-prolyl cis-trans isomerase 2